MTDFHLKAQLIKAAANEKARRDALEALLDMTSLATLLDDLSAIAHEKSAHVLECWGDNSLAMAWSKAARATSRLADRREIGAVSV